MGFQSATAIPQTSANILGVSGIFEFFVDQDTDANGETTIALGNAPTNVKKIMVTCASAGFIASVKSLSSSNLTLTIYKGVYDKTDTSAGTPTNLPSSTSVDNTAGGFAVTSGVPSATIGGGNNSPSNIPTLTHTHSTTINKLTSHDHTLGVTETSLTKALNESGTIHLTVFYEK